jgi:hypothetical protein
MKSAYFPKLLAVLLIVAGCSWMAQFFVGLVAPELGRTESFLAVGAIGELVFMSWLLLRAANAPASEQTGLVPGEHRDLGQGLVESRTT